MSTVKPGGKIAIILLAVGGIGFGVFKLRETLPKQVETTTETVTTPEPSKQPTPFQTITPIPEEIVKTVDLSNTEAPQVKKKEASVKKDKPKKKSNSSKPAAEDSHSEAPSNSNNVIPNF